MHEFTSSATIPCSPPSLRSVLGDPRQLPEISDPDLELEVLSAPEQVTEDTVIEFRISAHGFRQRMQHRYVEVSEFQIVAEQIEGPTRAWIHRQTIVANDDGTCTLTDHVQFEPPGGMMGFVLTADRIRESLEEGMAFRYEALRQICGT
ncbi:MAG: hypothetical protein KDA81_20915 [Planctomycetaceae bacterium]|nr:hypothetical protein [Planctomycetaceae bacterium]